MRESNMRSRTPERVDQLRAQLFEAIHSLQSVEECYRFFEDLCTVKEIRHFAHRLEVAKRLREGQTYLEIIIDTNASSECISRVKRNLESGHGGLERVLDRMEQQREIRMF